MQTTNDKTSNVITTLDGKVIVSTDLPLDYENLFLSSAEIEENKTSSVADALILSVKNLCKVDIEYISALTNKPHQEVIDTLGDAIFQNPLKWEETFYKGYETADEYLSGNLWQKWSVAWENNIKYGGYFTRNLRALEKAMPVTPNVEDIYVTLGSPWLPPDVINEFICYLLGFSNYYSEEEKVTYDEFTGTWYVPLTARYNKYARSYATYGTKRMPALSIIEKTLNLRPVAVYDTYTEKTDGKTVTHRVFNQEETLLALDKQDVIIKQFQKWVWHNEKRKERLKRIYERKFGYVIKRTFNGSFLTFPNLNENVTLFDHQRNSIARILLSKNTLLAHEVGAGKTYIMIVAGMELRRIGLSKKNLYVVPNNLVGSWANAFYELYKDANVLTVTPSDFTPSKRLKIIEKIQNDDYDGIIMAFSCFDLISVSNEYRLETLRATREKLDKLLEKDAKKYPARTKARENVQKQIKALLSSIKKLSIPAFDTLDIDRLFVDEAHNYKNVEVETKITNVLGISTSGSSKCTAMMEKVKYVQRRNDGGGVVFATGTPITNSLTDVFVMQKYLQSAELELVGLNTFDAWIGTFAERETNFEIDVDTSSYRLATRFSKFHNLPELTALLSSIADFYQIKVDKDLPKFNGYTDVLIAKTPEFENYLSEISNRADLVRSHSVPRNEDNMLKITTDGRKAALDLRLVDDTLPYNENGKVTACAQNVSKIYHDTRDNKYTQIIFCDTSVPKASFNVYNELKRLLIETGVDEDEIAFVHHYQKDEQREKLFESMRKGEIRVLIGSTFKLGMGVNVQDKLIACHHLDVPWRPADMIQREGRIIRQGNSCKTVYIYRYVTEGSFDAYSWQILETKERFICKILSGSVTERHGQDLEDTVLSYAEIKALAVGNELVKKRVETANELQKAITIQKKRAEERDFMKKELLELPLLIREARTRANDCYKDYQAYESIKLTPISDAKKEEITSVFDALKQNALKNERTPYSSYKGFDIILPDNMLEDKPYIILKGAGEYFVEIGGRDGVVLRIENFLKNLRLTYMKLYSKKDELETRKTQIEEILSQIEDNSEIEKLTRELEEYDKLLWSNDK